MEKRTEIRVLNQEGYTEREIAARLSIPKTSVHNTISRFKTHGTLKSLPRSGRPRKTTTRIDARIVRMANQSDAPSAVDIAEQLAKMNLVDISPITVRRRLNESGIEGTVRVRKPLLTKRHIKMRLEFCKKYQNWTVDDWKRVLWSDETKVNLHGSDGIVWTWKRKNEPLKQKHVKQTIKHDKSIMVWGCFSSAGLGDLHIIEGVMTSPVYVRILSRHMLPSSRRLIGPSFIFQQDNDPKHRAKNTEKWLKEKKIETLSWPSQSPDLNPIENLWSELKKKVHERKLSSMHRLREVIQECWLEISQEYCKRLVESMPRRIDEVIKNKGLWTKY
jgi:transposase